MNLSRNLLLLLRDALITGSIVLLRRCFCKKGLAAAVREVRRHGGAGAAVRFIGRHALAKTAFAVARLSSDNDRLGREIRRSRQSCEYSSL
jgi:hypothetical protein